MALPGEGGLMAFDLKRIRRDFPILATEARGKPLVYLDNAATTQKPVSVIEAEACYYRQANANVHRGVHWLSECATRGYEGARERAAKFIGARDPQEIVFVRGTTEAINLVASSFGQLKIGKGDEILVSQMEHHSNIVPWQMLCQRTGAKLKVIPIDDAGDLVMERLDELLTPRTKMVSLVYVSNALGTVNPVREVIAAAKRVGAAVMLDAAQAAPHLKIDVAELGCDFLAFSSHKMYGPTGIGVLWGRREWLDAMPPYQGGGDMIRTVTFEKSDYNVIPYKFEAGTPHIAGAVAFAAAMDYLDSVGLDAIARHEADLIAYGTELLGSVSGVRLVGTARKRAGALSFVIEGIHPHDIGTILDQEGIAVRTGHHCAQPVMDRFGVPATARASVGLYNTREELERLAEGLEKVKGVFA